MNKACGFSLIEVVVVLGILSAMVVCTFFIGFPEYNRYLIYLERQYLVDTLLESRTRSSVGDNSFVVLTWTSGYCIQDLSNLCVVPAHSLPVNTTLEEFNFATSTKFVLKNTIQVEVNVDQYGFVDGQ